MAGDIAARSSGQVRRVDRTTFDQLLCNAVIVMHKKMHRAPYTGEPDRDFATTRIGLA
jgi:hypothetical protein